MWVKPRESAGSRVVPAAIAASLACIIATARLGASTPLPLAATGPANPMEQARSCLKRAKAAADEVPFELDVSRAYRVIADVQLKIADADQARLILHEARRAADDYRDPSPKTQELVYIAQAQYRAGDIAAAKFTLADASESAGKCISPGECSMWHSHIAVWQHWLGDAAAEAANWQAAEREADRDSEVSQNFDYARLAGDLVTVKKAAEVQRILGKVKDRIDASIAYREFAEAQANAGDIPGARQTLHLVREGDDISDAVAAIAKAQARASDITAATTTALSITRDTYYRDSALGSIASIQADHGDLTSAIATEKRIEAPSYHPEAREHIATRQIQAHDPAAQATIAAIAKTVQAMDQPREQAETLCAVASLERASGDAEGARKSLKQARVATDKLDGSDGIQAGWNGKWGLLGRIAAVWAALGDFAQARATAAALPDIYGDNDRTAACRAIAAAQVCAGDLAGAERWIKSLKSDYDRAFAWVGVADALSQFYKPGRN